MPDLNNKHSPQTHTQSQTGAAPLSELRRKKYTHYFRLWDVEHKGYITFEDFTLLTKRTAALDHISEDSDLYQKMMDYTKANWDEMIQDVDSNNDGKLSLSEWLNYCNLFTRRISEGDYPRINELEQYARTFFAAVDQDGDGKIYVEHWKRFTSVWGIDGDSVDMFMRLDPADKGYMTFDDFMDRYYEFILSDEDTAPGNFLFGTFY